MSDTKNPFEQMTDEQWEAFGDKLEALPQERQDELEESLDKVVAAQGELEDKMKDAPYLQSLDKAQFLLEAEQRIAVLSIQHPELMVDLMPIAEAGLKLSAKVDLQAEEETALEIHRLMEQGKVLDARNLRQQMLERYGLWEELLALEDRTIGILAKYDEETALFMAEIEKSNKE